MKSTITMLEPFKPKGSQSEVFVYPKQCCEIPVSDKQPDPITTILIYGGKEVAVIISCGFFISIVLSRVAQLIKSLPSERK